MIVFKDVSKIYKMGDEELRALDHASLHIREGEFVAIIGPSGSGKSTLMNIMGCLDTADEGEYPMLHSSAKNASSGIPAIARMFFKVPFATS